MLYCHYILKFLFKYFSNILNRNNDAFTDVQLRGRVPKNSSLLYANLKWRIFSRMLLNFE